MSGRKPPRKPKTDRPPKRAPNRAPNRTPSHPGQRDAAASSAARKKPQQPRNKPAQINNKAHKEPARSPFMELTVGNNGLWLYGRHTVAAAIANPSRHFYAILATRQGAQWMIDKGLREELVKHQVLNISTDELDELLPAGCVHQGVAALASPLETITLEELETSTGSDGPVIVLDQITDPQNIGAIFRASAAFGARAIIVQDRRTPPLAGALAKAATGAIEVIPCIEVVNIARAINALKDMHFHCIGLAGEGTHSIDDTHHNDRVAIIMGAEGSGLRPLVAKSCDVLAHIPIHAQVESLNVATATAITLYALDSTKRANSKS